MRGYWSDRTSRKLFGVSLCITMAGTILGMVSAPSVASLAPLDVPMKPLFSLPSNPGFADLLVNNVPILTLVVLGGGLATLLVLFISGIPLGFEILHNSHVYLIVPHGIFEFPALWLAGAAGFHPCVSLIQYLREERDSPIDRDTTFAMLWLAILSIILLIIAAIVEVTITKRLAELVSG